MERLVRSTASGGLRAAAWSWRAGWPSMRLCRPDSAPAVFGYHEVFHLLAIAGVAAHFLAISLFALPTG
jgi:predicted membrane channel-forming protein YqfA (hemolysin III family)